MEFNELVKKEFTPILEKYNFHIIEESNNIVRFESQKMKINLIFNPYDKSCYIEMGKIGEMLYPLDNNTVRDIFKKAFLIEYLTKEEFVSKISSLFEQQEGVEMLKGNISNLERLVTQESQGYTIQLVKEQLLKRASDAWLNNDYNTFINILDEMSLDKIPKSYRLKYNIAKDKLL